MKISAKISRLIDNPESATKAYASITLDKMFAVHGLKVVEGQKGLFVSMPNYSYQDRDGNTQYKDIFHGITRSAFEAVQKTVLNAYNNAVNQSQQTEIEIGEDDEAEELSDEPEPEFGM